MSAKLSCPYCGSQHLDQPKSALSHGAEQLIALGYKVPEIQNCLDCHATLAPTRFVTGSPEWQKQHDFALSAR